uniref:Uncharacterized protein n=1 Tax=viral metagenome TaxID=1070528 RepID=A0A6C0JWI2_9ZZZZ
MTETSHVNYGKKVRLGTLGRVERSGLGHYSIVRLPKHTK